MVSADLVGADALTGTTTCPAGDPPANCGANHLGIANRQVIGACNLVNRAPPLYYGSAAQINCATTCLMAKSFGPAITLYIQIAMFPQNLEYHRIIHF